MDIFPSYSSPANKILSFHLPPPARDRAAAHYYLNVTIRNPAGADQKLARGTLFYFWIDAPVTTPFPDDHVEATQVGVIANSSKLQTAEITKALGEIKPGTRLLFPGGLYHPSGHRRKNAS